MKVEILSSLKGSSLWRKGLVFDDTIAPIPGDILKEVEARSPVVKVTRERAAAEIPIAAVKTEIEIIKSVEEEPDIIVSEDPLQEQIPITVPEKEESVQKETSKKFECKLCPWEGKTAPALKRHMTLVHK
jgi:hypothetical protein